MLSQEQGEEEVENSTYAGSDWDTWCIKQKQKHCKLNQMKSDYFHIKITFQRKHTRITSPIDRRGEF